MHRFPYGGRWSKRTADEREATRRSVSAVFASMRCCISAMRWSYLSPLGCTVSTVAVLDLLTTAWEDTVVALNASVACAECARTRRHITDPALCMQAALRRLSPWRQRRARCPMTMSHSHMMGCCCPWDRHVMLSGERALSPNSLSWC